MHLFYGSAIFDCLQWFSNYLTIDPELSTLKRVILQKLPQRFGWASEFANSYEIQTLIVNLLSLNIRRAEDDSQRLERNDSGMSVSLLE